MMAKEEDKRPEDEQVVKKNACRVGKKSRERVPKSLVKYHDAPLTICQAVVRRCEWDNLRWKGKRKSQI